MLAAELERRHPGEPERLHAQAGEWYAGQGDLDAAVYHYLAGRRVKAAADIVASSWPLMWDKGQAETVRRWLLAFDDRQILAHKPLTARRRLGVHSAGCRRAGHALGQGCL